MGEYDQIQNGDTIVIDMADELEGGGGGGGGDGITQDQGDTRYNRRSQNLGDLANVSTAITNLNASKDLFHSATLLEDTVLTAPGTYLAVAGIEVTLPARSAMKLGQQVVVYAVDVFDTGDPVTITAPGTDVIGVEEGASFMLTAGFTTTLTASAAVDGLGVPAGWNRTSNATAGDVLPATVAAVVAAIAAHVGEANPHTQYARGVEIDVRNYGAVAGSGDDTAAFEAAIAALPPAGGTIVVPAGVWSVRRRIAVPTGSTIRGMKAGTMIGKPAAVRAELTADVAVDDTVIEVASSAGFNVGDEITLLDEGNREWQSHHAVVTATGAGTITLDTPAPSEYLVSANGYIVSCFPLITTAENGTNYPAVIDLILNQNATADVDPTDEFTVGAIHWEGAYHALVEGVQIIGAAGDGISDQARSPVLDPDVAAQTGNVVRNCGIYSPGRHGVHLGSSIQGVIVDGVEVVDATNPAGMGVFLCAYAQRNVIVNNRFVNCAAGIDGTDARDVGNIMANNQIIGGEASIGWGITVGPRGVASGNEVTGHGGGIRAGYDINSFPHDITVLGNIVELRSDAAYSALDLGIGGKNQVVAGNRFRAGPFVDDGFGADDLSGQSESAFAVLMEDTVGARLTGNVWTGFRNGVTFTGECSDVVFEGTVDDLGLSVAPGAGFAFIGGTHTDISLDTRGCKVAVGNLIVDSSSPTIVRRQVNGVTTSTAGAGSTALTNGTQIVWADVTAGNGTVVLPNPALQLETDRITIKRTDNSGNTLDIDPFAAEAVETASLAAGASVTLAPRDGDWWAV